MPCKLPEDLSIVTDDVFSYMCSLAMEKCSKKSEKKKASCGGAAMRKRLLIKNFVTQMLAQERQKNATYGSSCQREEYEVSSDDSTSHTVNYDRSVDEEEDDDNEDEENTDQESEEEYDDVEVDVNVSTSLSTKSYYQLGVIPTCSDNNFLSLASSSTKDTMENDEDDDEEDEDEDGDDDDEDDGEEDGNENEDERKGIENNIGTFVHHHSYEMLSYGCVDNSEMSSINDNLMFMSPCTSSSICSTSELIFCDSSSAIYSGTSHIYDPNSSVRLLPVTTMGLTSVPTTPAVLYTPSTTTALSSTLSGSMDGDVYTSTTLTTMCPVLQNSGSEWDEFHTVPLSRDYVVEESSCHTDGYYSLYPPYTSVALPAVGFMSSDLLSQQNPSNQCHDIENSSMKALSCTSPDPSLLEGTLTQTNNAPIILTEYIPEKSITESMDSSVEMSRTIASSSANYAITLAEPLPENFLEDNNVITNVAAIECDNVKNEKSMNKKKDDAFLDDKTKMHYFFTNYNSDVESKSSNNNDTKMRNLNRISQKNDENEHQVNLTILEERSSEFLTNSIMNSTRPNSPLSTSNALQTFVTMIPPMLKMGNCRSEFHTKSAVISSYRRCITDLDTNTIVEEEYGGYHTTSVEMTAEDNNINSIGTPFTMTTRKRASPIYTTLDVHGNDEYGIAETDSCLGPHDCNHSSNTPFCSMLMLTASPKRLRL